MPVRSNRQKPCDPNSVVLTIRKKCVTDWPEGQPDPYHVYVGWLKQPPNKGRCLRLSRGRWPIEQYFQRGKDDLGLDHYEGRSWRGFHHHLVMAAVAYLFVVMDYLRAKKTSGLTWEQALRAMQPLIVRSRGFCPCCLTEFKDSSPVST